jgi:DNA-binding CsgD family transcriptional regulator
LLDLTTRSGCRILNDYADWAEQNGKLDAPKRPYLMGVSREDALHIENQWMARMFTYFAPVFHFTEAQRQILVLAREGFTDVEIAEQLSITSDAVKKRWSAVYARVHSVFPDLLPESPLGGRGAEKRRALLAHLRERPEELRAYAVPAATPPRH